MNLLGEHPRIVALRALVERVARSQARTVLIYGETGTGKGLVARSIHQQSARARKAFVDLNCAAIPAALLESELFGHEKGAFTGAVAKKQGLIEAADGGTLFLDEVRELDPVMQAKILTLLDTRSFRRVGAVRSIAVDVRVIAATNRILLGEVKAGKFRDDLYYRLQVIAINVPPLRERGDDLFLLTESFLAKYNAQYGSRLRQLSEDTRRIFRAYPWPGNVRELENLVERLCLLQDGDTIEPAQLPQRILRETAALVPAAAALAVPSSPGEGASPMQSTLVAAEDYHAATERFQRELIRQALHAAGGQPGAAAASLGLTRHALRHQMRKLGMAADGA